MTLIHINKLDFIFGRLVHLINHKIYTCHTTPGCESTQPPSKWIINLVWQA